MEETREVKLIKDQYGYRLIEIMRKPNESMRIETPLDEDGQINGFGKVEGFRFLNSDDI